MTFVPSANRSPRIVFLDNFGKMRLTFGCVSRKRRSDFFATKGHAVFVFEYERANLALWVTKNVRVSLIRD